MPIEKKRTVIDYEIVFKLIDTETKHVYRRIICGLGWPYGNRPGFVAVVAEDFDRDHAIEHSPRQFHVLDEHESPEIESLHRHCLKFIKKFHLEEIYGNRANPLNELWQQWGGAGILYPSYFDTITLNLVSQLIRKNIGATRKTLSFAKSKLPGYLTAFKPEMVETDNLEHNPPIAALGYCLSELERTEPVKMPVSRPPKMDYGPSGWMAS